MKKATVIAASALLPLFALAQSNTVEGIISKIGSILALVIPILITLAVVYFFWGLVQYIGGDADKKSEGRSHMIWGIIALFVMVSVFGLIRVVGNTFGVQQGGSVDIPIVPVR